MLIALVVVVAAVALAVLGGGDTQGRRVAGGLAEPQPETRAEPLPLSRPVTRADVAELCLAVSPRGYRMDQVDDVLDRLGAELAERDARIAELESRLAGAQAVADGRLPGVPGAEAPPPPGGAQPCGPQEFPSEPARPERAGWPQPPEAPARWQPPHDEPPERPR